MKRLQKLAVPLLLFMLGGCAPSMNVKRMDPIRLPHTYSLMLLTDHKPTEVEWKLLGKMEETINFEQELNVVYLPQVEYFDGSSQTLKAIALSGADTLVLFHRLQLSETPSGYRLSAVMDFLEPVWPSEKREVSPGKVMSVPKFISKGERESSVELNQKVSLGEAINLMGTKLALEISDEITPAQDTKMASPYLSPLGGLADTGEEGGF